MHITEKFSSLKRMILTAGTALAATAVIAAPPPPPYFAPIIKVAGMSTYIPDGSVQPLKLDGTYFGKAELGVNTWEHSFDIRNEGNADLLLTTPLTLTGPNAADFAVTQQPAGLVAPGQRTSFKVRYTPSFVGNAYATVNIDSNHIPYDFEIRGDGVDQPLVGPDLEGTLVYYKKYKCRGIPLLSCKMNARVEVRNLSQEFDQDYATVRAYVVRGDLLDDSAFLITEKLVKKLKRYNPGKNPMKPKKIKVKKVKVKGWVPPGYTHIYSEVVPEGGSEDIDYINNRTEHLYGIF